MNIYQYISLFVGESIKNKRSRNPMEQSLKMENPEKQAQKTKKMGVQLPFMATDQTFVFILQLHVLASYGHDFVIRFSELQIERIFEHFRCYEKKVLYIELHNTPFSSSYKYLTELENDEQLSLCGLGRHLSLFECIL